ncbi:Unknown protein [Striga hermonthica]|uniref:Uncharacterized protein n=1 Tax=Striga hermonthica TaxID=68872 RepID=A0A9N7N6Q5_STRHE|nr:Unknown protein [Striga hermonthica]
METTTPLSESFSICRARFSKPSPPPVVRRKSPIDASTKLDTVNSCLLGLEAKLDSSPTYPQAIAVKVTSAGISNKNTVPYIWNFRSATSKKTRK